MKKIFSYSRDNASAAVLSEDYSDNDLPLTAVKEMLLSEDKQQELTEIRNIYKYRLTIIRITKLNLTNGLIDMTTQYLHIAVIVFQLTKQL